MADTTPVGVRIPDDLLVRIDEFAATEQRTRNNMILVLLGEAIDARDAARVPS